MANTFTWNTSGTVNTLTLPITTDTVVARSTTDQLNNKQLVANDCFFVDLSDTTKRLAFTCSSSSTGTTLFITTNQTFSGSGLSIPNVPTGDTMATIGLAQTLVGKTLLDGSTAIANTGDNTKQLVFSLGGNTTAKTLTLSAAQSTSQTLHIPNIVASDTIATLGLAETFSGAITFSANPTITGTNGALNFQSSTVLIGYASGSGSYFSDSVSGTLCFRNTGGVSPLISWGHSGSLNSDMNLDSTGNLHLNSGFFF